MPEWFSSDFVLEAIVPKVSMIVIIIICAVVISRMFNHFLLNWQKRIIARLERKKVSTIASTNTKMFIIRRVAVFIIYMFALIMILLQFEAVRNIGAGLLASAGVAGIVIGMAAQNTLSDLIAGVSISFSQPVRLGDAVIFENEFGWVEEISLMHTIIKTWDNRRIIVPNSVIIKKVIQNWTMKDPSLLGIVVLYVDYMCEIEDLKKWVKDIVGKSEYATEEKISVVQVVDFTEKTMVIRVLAKGPDAPSTWNLRCEIREKLIKKFKEKDIPLPTIRIDARTQIAEKK